MDIPGIAASHQIITDTCRANRGDQGAFAEAIARIQLAYTEALLHIPAGANLRLVLMVERPDRPALQPARFFEDLDNSSHRYFVPVSKRAEWNAWNELPGDDERGWDAPEWATRIDGGTLTFADPKIERL